MTRIVYFNGELIPEREARLSLYDSALVLGDMAYEVTRTCAGRPFQLRTHLQRLEHSLRALQIDPRLSLNELEAATLATLERNQPTESPDVDWNIIHNISRGPAHDFRRAFMARECRPTVLISCYPLVDKLAALAPAFTQGIDLVVPAQRSIPSAVFDASLKTRSRAHFQLANLQAHALCPGATAALLDDRGFLTEGTSGNLFFVQRGRLLTPTTRNVLPGVTRGLILSCAQELGLPAAEADLTLADAQAADEAFATSTSIGLLHARSFEGQPIGDGRLGPISGRLRAALQAIMGVDVAAQARRYAQMLAGGA